MNPVLFMLLCSALLLLTSTACLIRAKDKWLKSYFAAHTACNIVLFVFDEPTEFYEMMFTIITVLILIASAGYLVECSRIVVWQIRLAVLMFGISAPALLYVFAVNGLSSQMHTIPSYLMISIGECCVLLCLGICLGIFSVTIRGASIPLALLWILLSAWQYAWTMGYPFYPALLDRLNQFIPTSLVVGFFVWAFFVENQGEKIQNYGRV